MTPLIDVHTHHYYKAHDGIISIKNIDAIDELIEYHQHYALGVHPWHTLAVTDDDIVTLIERIVANSHIIAIGECGIDTLRGATLDRQAHIFSQQIAMAQELNLPLIIHCVRAYDRVLHMLQKAKIQVPAVFHGFNRSASVLNQVIQAGHYISISEYMTQSSKHEIVADIPIDRLFIETDDGATSLETIYDSVAKILNISVEKLSLQILENFNRVFIKNQKQHS